MINLLPDERKTDLGSARANLITVRYILIVLLAVAFLLGALATSHSVLRTTKKNADNIIATNDVKADIYSDTAQQVQALSSQLEGARAALDQEVRYSVVLTKLGGLIPAGAVLGELPLGSSSFNGTPTQMKAYVKTDAIATQLQNNLQSSGLFGQVSLQGTATDQGIAGYPVTVTMSVTFNRLGAQ